MARRVARSTATLMLAMLACVCGAQNLTFLQDTPGVTFNDEDRKLQLDAAIAVLSDPNPRLSKEWKNPATGHSGSFQGLGNLRSEDGLHCRKIKILSEGEGRKNQMVLPVCQTAEGDWMFASGKQLTQMD
jgi:hypothetical protein